MNKIEINDNTAIMSLQSIRHFGVPAGNVTADESIRYAIKAIDTLAKVRERWEALRSSRMRGDISAQLAEIDELLKP